MKTMRIPVKQVAQNLFGRHVSTLVHQHGSTRKGGKKDVAQPLKVCNSDTLGMGIWNFPLPNCSITTAAWHRSRSTSIQQVSNVHNVTHRERRPEFFVKLGAAS